MYLGGCRFLWSTKSFAQRIKRKRLFLFQDDACSIWVVAMYSLLLVRFVRTSQALLAPNYVKFDNKDYDWLCFIEIVRVNGGDRDDQRELDIFNHLQRMLMFEGGRPHWGLNFDFPFTLDYLKKIYPEVDKWIEAKNFFDPNGTFESRFVQSWFRSEVQVQV